MRSLLRLSSADSSPRRAEVGSTGVVHVVLYKLLFVSYLLLQNISLFVSLPRYSGGERRRVSPLSPVLRGEGPGVRGVRQYPVRKRHASSGDTLPAAPPRARPPRAA